MTKALIDVELRIHICTSSHVDLFVWTCQMWTFTVTYPGRSKAMKSTRR